jgi:mannitol 2-dehydrogenase
VRIVSLTITEGGYFYDAARDEVQLDAPGLAHDLEDPSHPTTAFGYLVEGLRRRRSAGVAPFTVLSCDNLHANGDVTGRVVTALASHIDANLGRWIYGQVAFPNSMVDRITPRTTKTDIGIVTRLTGLDDAWPVTCEPFSQWVIEDRFPTGRPAWERVGAQLVDDVRPYELMKMRLLNAGHQVFAYPGWLLGFRYAYQACTDPTIRRLLERYLNQEGSQTLPDLPGVDLGGYSATIVERFGNPQVEDALARLSFQSSTMISTYLLPVVRDLIHAWPASADGYHRHRVLGAVPRGRCRGRLPDRDRGRPHPRPTSVCGTTRRQHPRRRPRQPALPRPGGSVRVRTPLRPHAPAVSAL